MKISALVSGQAGLLAVRNAAGYHLYPRNRSDGPIPSSSISYVLDGCNDAFQTVFSSLEEGLTRRDLEWAKVRAVRLFLMLVDPTEPDPTALKAARLLESILPVAGVRAYVESRLFASELPSPNCLVRTLDASEHRLTDSLFQEIIKRQPQIARARSAFDSLSSDLFESPATRLSLHEAAVESGAVRALVLSEDQPGAINNALFLLHKNLLQFENYREIVREWGARFSSGNAPVRSTRLSQHEDSEERVFEEDWSRSAGAGGRQAFENALQQQKAIVAKVAEGDFDSARRYTTDLVRQQLAQGSGTEYVAKSLTRLSQEAKEMEAFELNLEWAYEAKRLAPEDPRTRGQLGDALLQFGRFEEAIAEFDAAGTFGDPAYALSGRARTYRARGQAEEALATYESVRTEFAGTDQERFGWAGVAEVWRDLGEPARALEEYSKAVDRFPYDAVIRSGRAATLVELGRLDEAWEEYSQALMFSRDKAVVQNGMASLLRYGGYLDRALAAYRQLSREHPGHVISHCGLSDVLRAMGRSAEALQLLEDLVKRFPGSPSALRKRAEALGDCGRHVDAVLAYRKAMEQFPYDASFSLGLASAERMRGRYDRALQAYDSTLKRFPRNLDALLGRASMLRRLQSFEDSQAAYRAVLEKNPDDLRAKNGLASILIFLRNFDDALGLLTIGDPRTQDEWRSFFLRGKLDERAGFPAEAQSRFKWAATRCPFFRERRLFVAGLARLLISKGKAREAANLGSGPKNEVSNVISFHAYASSKQTEKAKRAYAELKSFLPRQYAELRDEIAARYKITNIAPRRSASWILNQESDVLLLEAA